MNKLSSAIMITTMVLLAGCATDNLTRPMPNRAAPPSGTDTAVAAASNVALNITPFTQYKEYDLDNDAKGDYFTNAYTRLRIEPVFISEKFEQKEKLEYQASDWRTRMLLGKRFDVNLSLKVSIGNYESTVPLMTASHQSTRNGEFWARSLSRTLLNFPLFLVRPDGEASVPSFRIKMAGTKEYDSNLAAKTLDLVVNSVQILSPEAGVLTKLTAQASRDKSQAIDSAINRLFANGISEEQVVHRDLRRWREKGGIQVTFEMPSEENWNKSEGIVGTWRITFEEPRPSIFGDWLICGKATGPRCALNSTLALKEVHKELSAPQVLSYPIVNSSDGLGCVFHAKLDTHSTANWTPGPAQIGHPFQRKLDTGSTSNWTV